MTHPHLATPHEAATLAKLELGATGVIVVRMKEQPHMVDFGDHDSLAWEKPHCADGYLAVGVDRVRESATYLKCPYKPGDVVAVKEKWGYFGGDEYLYQRDIGAVGYEVTHDLTHIGQPIPGGKWRPARSMPAWAVRTHLRVRSIACKRLQEITIEESLLAGSTGYKSYIGHGDYTETDPVEHYAEQHPAAWSANDWHWFITGEKCNP